MADKKKLVVNKKVLQQLTDEELSAVVGATFDGVIHADSSGPGGSPPGGTGKPKLGWLP